MKPLLSQAGLDPLLPLSCLLVFLLGSLSHAFSQAKGPVTSTPSPWEKV